METKWEMSANIFEYGSAANPPMAPIPVLAHPPTLHESGPMQDAGLFTHQRTLDIRFVDDEVGLHRAGRIRGTALTLTDEQYANITT